uniref:Uncharacterized protein n=1 Tax=Tetraselmis sp. GSL018 TaxID=582737 RepID=A0A061R601_9CHLO
MRLFQTNIVFWWCNYNWVFSSSAMLFKVHSSSSDLSIKLQELEGDTTASCLGPCASLVCASSATQCLASNAVGALALAAVGGAYAAPAAAAGAVHFSSGFGQVAGGCVSGELPLQVDWKRVAVSQTRVFYGIPTELLGKPCQRQ